MAQAVEPTPSLQMKETLTACGNLPTEQPNYKAFDHRRLDLTEKDDRVPPLAQWERDKSSDAAQMS